MKEKSTKVLNVWTVALYKAESGGKSGRKEIHNAFSFSARLALVFY